MDDVSRPVPSIGFIVKVDDIAAVAAGGEAE